MKGEIDPGARALAESFIIVVNKNKPSPPSPLAFTRALLGIKGISKEFVNFAGQKAWSTQAYQRHDGLWVATMRPAGVALEVASLGLGLDHLIDYQGIGTAPNLYQVPYIEFADPATISEKIERDARRLGIKGVTFMTVNQRQKDELNAVVNESKGEYTEWLRTPGDYLGLQGYSR